MRSLLPCLFSLAACSPPATEAAGPARPSLRLRTARGLEELGAPGVVHALPRVSRSERVPRPLLDRRGVVVSVEGLVAPEVRARFVRHRADQRVVVTSSGPLLVDPPRLPAAVRGDGDLPHLARQDGNVVSGRVLLERPGGEAGCLVLVAERGAGWGIGVDGAAHDLPPGPTGALVLTDPGPTTTLDLRDAPLDQAFFARAVPVATTEPARSLSAGPDELAWEPPPGIEEGQSWTLLLEVTQAGVGPVGARPAEAAAPATGPLVDVTARAGLAFVHLEGPDEQLDIRPTMGPGLAWGDVDGDGLPDLFLVQGGGRAGSEVPGDRLYRNLGAGRFADVTSGAGLANEAGAGMGALLADLDGDGDLDLFVANYGDDRLHENDGGGRFSVVPAFEPLGLWSAGVCAADIEGDGDLDLYVTSYLDYDPAKMPEAPGLARYRREDPLEMLPFAFPGARNRLLVNQGGLRFEDVTAERGLLDAAGRGMQAVFWDFDRDGDPDLYVANDVSPNVLFRNEGDGTFTDVSFATGLDDPRGGMGLAVGDVDRDGDEDLFLTNWQLEANALYTNQLLAPFEAKHRRASFHDATVRAGLGPAGMGVTSWGAELLDLELDGDLDLFVANGYTSPDYEGTGICVGQPNHLFVAREPGRFEQVHCGALEVALASRAVAGCDHDRDGDVDLVVSANNGRVQLLRNDAPRAGRWLGIALRGAGGNTHAIGAEVTVEVDGRTLRRSLRAGTSYLACGPPELHFGLGQVGGPVTVRVRWPWAGESRHELSDLDRWIVIER